MSDEVEQYTEGELENHTYPWRWWYLLVDNKVDGKPYMRWLASGYNDVLKLAPGPWPSGYKVPNGQEGGGYPASGSSADQSCAVRIQPPSSGNGRVSFQTFGKIVVTNADTQRTGSFACGFGVAHVNGPNQPMYPYLGVAHDYDINQITPEHIAAGHTRSIFIHRLDIVDQTFTAGIPNWPNWKMKPHEVTLLYPAITPCFKNTGPTALKVGGLFIWGCAT